MCIKARPNGWQAAQPVVLKKMVAVLHDPVVVVVVVILVAILVAILVVILEAVQPETEDHLVGLPLPLLGLSLSVRC